MKRVVLIDGVETYQCAGLTLHLGRETEVPDDVANHLLQQRCPTGPQFALAENCDRRLVQLRLTAANLTYRSAAIFAEGSQPVGVMAAVAPFLLRLKRRDGEPLFEQV